MYFRLPFVLKFLSCCFMYRFFSLAMCFCAHFFFSGLTNAIVLSHMTTSTRSAQASPWFIGFCCTRRNRRFRPTRHVTSQWLHPPHDVTSQSRGVSTWSDIVVVAFESDQDIRKKKEAHKYIHEAYNKTQCTIIINRQQKVIKYCHNYFLLDHFRQPLALCVSLSISSSQ